jgi:inner membrane protein
MFKEGVPLMPTVVTHALAGAAVGHLLAPGPMPPSYYAVAAGLGVLPDLDVLAFSFGIPYGSRFGHRGFSHSLLFSALAGLLAALPLAGWFGVPWWHLWVAFAAVTVSHTLLDALTDGGLGVAFFSPFNDRRYFLPWRPIRVSPIGRAAFGRWGLRALLSEVVWVWVPLGLLVAVTLVGR